MDHDELEEQEDAQPLLRVAAFAMVVSPGACCGFYLSMVGFYVSHYQSRIFFLAMAFCMYLPGPFVFALQQFFDAKFDMVLTASVTYYFRIVFGQVILALVYLYWASTDATPNVVLGVGFIIGFFAQAAGSSSMQMAATIHPRLPLYAGWGNLCGNAMPVLVFFISGFGPAAGLEQFRRMLLVVPALCLMSVAFLGYLHGAERSIFNEAYNKLSQTSFREASAGDLNALGWTSEELLEAMPLWQRQMSEQGEPPTWVWIWCAYNGVSVMMNVSLMALVGFVGDPRLAQTLLLTKLAVDVVGAVVALPLSKLQCFAAGPWHKTLCSAALLRLGFGSLLLSHIVRWPWVFSPIPLIVLWVVFYGIRAVENSHIAITIAFFIHASDRKRIQRTNQGAIYVGCIVGILLAASILIPVFKMGTRWPDADHTIPLHAVDRHLL